MLTEAQLLHKRERKKRRRAARIRARTPEQEEARIGRMVDAIFKGHQGLRDLYEPLLRAEDERKELKEPHDDGDE